MTFTADIDIMPQPEILDPQGKAVQLGLHNLQLDQISQVRIGKHISLSIEAPDEATAYQLVDTACRQLLANLIMDVYTITIRPATA
jgi:phosphoribosylformylglycinamidine synthase subunit PurS